MPRGEKKRETFSAFIGGKEVKAMKYESPVLLAVGPASELVLGVREKNPVDRLPESDLRKGDDAQEVDGLDD